MAQDRDYVLGTHDEEIVRLGLQHRVWRPRASDAWRRAGFTVGQTLLDVGCGPGYATVDLAEIVGQSGHVVALDRSRRFLDSLEARSRQFGLDNITPYELDLDRDDFPDLAADGAWCRWVFAFVTRPRDLLARVARTLRPGGILVVHEYFHYSTWRTIPRSSEIEELIGHVIGTWRAGGGEPDIAPVLLPWLDELGFDTRSLTPIVDVISPAHFAWQWPKSYIEVGTRRMVDMGRLPADRADAIKAAFAKVEQTPGALMITPAVLEIIAVRR